ncbi:hypothetical protein BDZ88DRAFT_449083 [Geranomyces variabilis]|nr:hypothetical protein BDZ88DRAFT_449083 [Geranomyces variabilis]KAJ3139269.1 hypothetical protein HDU90_000635 [Geranomyces variabilis]
MQVSERPAPSPSQPRPHAPTPRHRRTNFNLFKGYTGAAAGASLSVHILLVSPHQTSRQGTVLITGRVQLDLIQQLTNVSRLLLEVCKRHGGAAADDDDTGSPSSPSCRRLSAWRRSDLNVTRPDAGASSASTPPSPPLLAIQLWAQDGTSKNLNSARDLEPGKYERVFRLTVPAEWVSGSVDGDEEFVLCARLERRPAAWMEDVIARPMLLGGGGGRCSRGTCKPLSQDNVNGVSSQDRAQIAINQYYMPAL